MNCWKKRVTREYNSGETDVDVNKLAIYYQNVNGLRLSIFDVRNAVVNSDYDIIIFSETGLVEHITDAQLNFFG